MSREIKFRVWDGQYWVYENIFLTHDGVLWYRYPYNRKLEKVTWKICFSTGLKDKNGKEIFEGDIVENKNSEIRVEVEFIEGAFGYYQKTTFISFTHEHYKYFEVIGNVFQSKELLDDSK